MADSADYQRALGAVRNVAKNPKHYMGPWVGVSHQEAVRFVARELEKEITETKIRPTVHVPILMDGEADYKFLRNRPFSDPVCIALACHCCGAIGIGYANGDGVERTGSARIAWILRLLSALDERGKTLSPRPRLVECEPKFPDGAPPDAGVRVKLDFGLSGTLEVMRTGDQYYLWSSDQPSALIALPERSALELAMAIIRVSDRVRADREARPL